MPLPPVHHLIAHVVFEYLNLRFLIGVPFTEVKSDIARGNLGNKYIRQLGFCLILLNIESSFIGLYMLPPTMSNSTSLSEEASVSSVTGLRDFGSSLLNPMFQPISSLQQQQKIKKKRSLPGNPDPDAEVIALTPKDLLATNRFVCEICNKGFQRDQNLQLHRRGHNLPWKLRQRSSTDIRKRAYVCPEPSCVHHHPSRALGDLTGIKKHFSRKHGEKKWKCEKCSKRYAVQSDWKAHSKTCGTREYRCDCGTLFSRKDSFITHRAFCDALAEESARLSCTTTIPFTDSNLKDHSINDLHLQNQAISLFSPQQHHFPYPLTSSDPPKYETQNSTTNQTLSMEHKAFHQIPNITPILTSFLPQDLSNIINSSNVTNRTHMSATALLQKAASVGAAAISGAPHSGSVGHLMSSSMSHLEMPELAKVRNMGTGISPESLATWHKSDRPTRDFLGLAIERGACDGGQSLLRPQGLGFSEPAAGTWRDC